MYCAREGKKWYCLDDETYERISRVIDGYVTENIDRYKKDGTEYFINKEGLYEQKESE